MTDGVTLESLSALHEGVEGLKASMAQTSELIETDMNGMISRLDQAIAGLRD